MKIDEKSKNWAEEVLEFTGKSEMFGLLDILPFYVILIDANHHILFANQKVKEKLGFNQEELIGQYCPKVVHGAEGHYPGCPLEEAIRTGRAQEREIYDEKLDSWLNSAIYPTTYRTREGVGVYLHFVQEITERKKSEKEREQFLAKGQDLSTEAKRRADELDAIFISLVEPVITFDARRVITNINAAAKQLLGFNPLWFRQDNSIEDVVSLFEKDKKTRIDGTIAQRALRGQKIIDEQFIFKNRQGEEIVVLVSASPIRSQNKILGGVVVLHEITEIVKMENALKKAHDELELEVAERTAQLVEANEKLKTEIAEHKQAEEGLIKTQKELNDAKRLSDIGTLAAMVAHELRNPLTVIKLAIYSIKKKNSNQAIESHLANIETKISDSEQIINNLLFYSKIQKPRREDVLIYDLLEECVKNVRNKFSDLKVKIRENYKKIKKITINFDPLQMKEVFNNILNNAFESLSNGRGEVEVAADYDESREEINIIFKDNGSGIDPDDLKKVGEPFFSRKSRGTGLGLTVCFRIIGLHGGKIDVKSDKGKGTTFKITLPVNSKEEG
ncbi:MAG: ATP-binding protein [Elusimicrobiota bacterium]